MVIRHRFASSVLRSSAFAVLFSSIASQVGAQQLQVTEIFTGLTQPIGVRAPAGDVHRVFVLDRTGRIKVIKDGSLQSAYFLDFSADVSISGEGGLLGLAFHPDFLNNGRFFVSFTSVGAHDPTVREYHVSANPDVADPTSGTTIFGPYPHNGDIHFGGDLKFGPDGKLYYTIGHLLPSPQSLTIYDGKMLRLDIDVPAPYAPADNPYAGPGDPGLDLIWAIGLRNPFRFAFDRLTGDLYIGDVGAAAREEIDFQPASFGPPGSPTWQGGRNYGWPCMEGTFCTGNSDCVCDSSGATLVLPVFETFHGSSGVAIIGGFPYRGHRIPGMQGRYFCADYGLGRFWTFLIANGHATQVQERTTELHMGAGVNLQSPDSFGEDGNGELYVTCLAGGHVFRIDPIATPCPAPHPYCVSTPNSVGSGARIDSTGSTSIAANELVLTAAHCPPNVAGVFFHGGQQALVPFVNGVLCVGGGLVRLSIVHTDENGFAHRAFDAVAAGMTNGQTRNFQFYYRNPAAGGALASTSDGLSVTFCP